MKIQKMCACRKGVNLLFHYASFRDIINTITINMFILLNQKHSFQNQSHMTNDERINGLYSAAAGVGKKIRQVQVKNSEK